MGLFSFLFKKKPVVFIQHPYFGQMARKHTKWPALPTYFECELYFKPVSARIPLSINADMEGPTRAQTDCFRMLEANYTSLLSVIAPRIKEDGYNAEEKFIFDDFPKDFRLHSLHIYADKGETIRSELSFITGLAPGYSFDVVLNGLELEEILITE